MYLYILQLIILLDLLACDVNSTFHSQQSVLHLFIIIYYLFVIVKLLITLFAAQNYHCSYQSISIVSILSNDVVYMKYSVFLRSRL